MFIWESTQQSVRSGSVWCAFGYDKLGCILSVTNTCMVTKMPFFKLIIYDSFGFIQGDKTV